MDSEFDVPENNITDEMLNTYTDTVIDHAMNPRNVGSIPNADGFSLRERSLWRYYGDMAQYKRW